MNIDITCLKNRTMKYIKFDEVIKIDKELLERTELLNINDIHVFGKIFIDSLDEYQISLTINGTMSLPCAITLKPVAYPFNIEVGGNVEELLEEINENCRKNENTIEIFPIIWENVLMEIPLRVVSEDAQDITMAGDGWQLITEIDGKTEINPELEKLQDLL